MGWFFGFKLHVVINHIGEIVDLSLSGGNIHDLKMVEPLSKNIFGYLFGDKGYISKSKAKKLKEEHDIHLITNVRSHMKSTYKTPLKRRCYRNTFWSKLYLENSNHLQISNIRDIEVQRIFLSISFHPWFLIINGLKNLE